MRTCFKRIPQMVTHLFRRVFADYTGERPFEPTRIYVTCLIKERIGGGIAHITGGGLSKMPRMFSCKLTKKI